MGEKNFSVLWNCVTEAHTIVQDAHDFDQFLHFYGSNSLDITTFEAKVEISLGEEGEKYLITEPTVLYIPQNTIHCPLVFKVVRKPVIVMNVVLTPQYVMPAPPE